MTQDDGAGGGDGEGAIGEHTFARIELPIVGAFAKKIKTFRKPNARQVARHEQTGLGALGEDAGHGRGDLAFSAAIHGGAVVGEAVGEQFQAERWIEDAGLAIVDD